MNHSRSIPRLLTHYHIKTGRSWWCDSARISRSKVKHKESLRQSWPDNSYSYPRWCKRWWSDLGSWCAWVPPWAVDRTQRSPFLWWRCPCSRVNLHICGRVSDFIFVLHCQLRWYCNFPRPKSCLGRSFGVLYASFFFLIQGDAHAFLNC